MANDGFDPIAREILKSLMDVEQPRDPEAMLASVVDQLAVVWNMRGAVDGLEVDRRLGASISPTVRDDALAISEALRALDIRSVDQGTVHEGLPIVATPKADNEAVVRVFVSYARADWDRVEPIIAGFKEAGWEVLTDRDILTGVPWRQRISLMLAAAYAVVVVWSRKSVLSNVVALEARVGLSKGRLFPVMIDIDAKPPEEFDVPNGVDISAWNGNTRDAMFKKVVDGVENRWSIDNDMKNLRPVRIFPEPARILKN
jgi:hypothetical protein